MPRSAPNTFKIAIMAALIIAPGAVAAAALDGEAPAERADADSTMRLIGGQQGTLFESLRVEGEDRVRIQFERPRLVIGFDALAVPGLDWESVLSAVGRTDLDMITPYLALSAGRRAEYYARPWLDEFSTEGVARFRPSLEGVDRWRLLIASSKGDTVAVFSGRGTPPREIAWDGSSLDGTPVPPGLTYSYVLEAYDRAGNRRNFVGEGFELPAYRIDKDGKRTMLFSGAELAPATPAPAGARAPEPAILLEVASWINQAPGATEPVLVEVTSRSFKEASRLADEVIRRLTPFLLIDPRRLQPTTHVEPDGPAAGTVAVVVSR
ncbi:MAG: hypothetical protein OEO21_06000 [Candidatus Krumholzibacteria bacterium]|nr:hypothetical protein [Candidatus Krumholzibacteria bacterium]